ncbi:MAG: GlsB/YeaQ/YmgE family stress response membrane protein [Desulfobulbus sp.]|nr:GlsB/YeaQ/YmgE family stress response membrane protein [Desulfobulbus sp.]
MDTSSLMIFVGIGALAGWLAGTIKKDWGFGLLGNVVIGVAGGVVGGFLFKLTAIATGGLIGSIVTAILAAFALLFLVNFFQDKKPS